MPLPDAQLNQNGLGSRVDLLRCEAGGCAGCMVLAVVRQWANEMEITGTVAKRRKRLHLCARSAS
jgi:hypothetical protein